MLFVAFCCSFWFLVRVSICHSLPFAVFCGCFHLSTTLLVVAFCWYEKEQQKAKNVQMETRLKWALFGERISVNDLYNFVSVNELR